MTKAEWAFRVKKELIELRISPEGAEEYLYTMPETVLAGHKDLIAALKRAAPRPSPPGPPRTVNEELTELYARMTAIAVVRAVLMETENRDQRAFDRIVWKNA